MLLKLTFNEEDKGLATDTLCVRTYLNHTLGFLNLPSSDLQVSNIEKPEKFIPRVAELCDGAAITCLADLSERWIARLEY